MKVIFLEIDYVLNTIESVERNKDLYKRFQTEIYQVDWQKKQDTLIVITSKWRLHLLNEQGMKSTPFHKLMSENNIDYFELTSYV